LFQLVEAKAFAFWTVWSQYICVFVK